ncbi:MAG TPA: IS3 family transposase, partial [Ktedonobacteraceae bacterium]|nr:IS3 family transposase [Ktedonobacteraceae bacterium]
MRPRQLVEVASQFCVPNGPYPKSQVARALGIGRATLYWPSKQAIKEKLVAVAIEQWYEQDDTLGHRKLAALLSMGKNRVRRVMHKYGITARRKRKKDVYPGKASEIAPNLVRELKPESLTEVVFSDIFEVRLADRTKLRGCFALWKRTRHILGLAFEYHMRAELVTNALQTLAFDIPEAIFHSDQGKQFGAEQTRALLLEKGFQLSMSRAGTPTDNGYAERFVGLFKLAVAERCSYQTLGEFLRAAQDWVQFYNTIRPHESL